jgi:hypothetical protein
MAHFRWGLPLERIAERLRHSFAMLISGSRSQPARLVTALDNPLALIDQAQQVLQQVLDSIRQDQPDLTFVPRMRRLARCR